MITMASRNRFSVFLKPLLGAVVGIYMQRFYPFNVWFILCGLLAGLLGTAFACIYQKERMCPRFVTMLCFFGGAYVLFLQCQEHHYIVRNYLSQAPIDIVATVTDKNDWAQANGKAGCMLSCHVTEVFNPATRHHNHETFDILCYVKKPSRATVGDMIVIKNATIQQSKKSQRPSDGQPTFYDYMIKEHYAATLFLGSDFAIKIDKRPYLSISRWLWDLRNSTYNRIKKMLQPQTCTYFGLIFLGNKQQEGVDELRPTFNNWGLAHYLARAGLHIILFIMIWSSFLKLIPIHITFKRFLLICICLIYNLYSWPSIPFIRAYYSFLLIQIGMLIGMQTNFLHILGVICFVVLLFNPLQLFFLDFQLTFALTFALAIFSPLLNDQKNQPGR